MDHMYIRHSVGSTLFFDSKKHAGTYALEEINDTSHIFTIHEADEALAKLLIENREELNLFVVPNGNPHKKTWYYSTDGLIEYDKAAQQFIIRTDRKLGYDV
ncbi:hypothetical protein Back11_42530 [Paenibacillus baekrokdamisoli]|uniref:Uncharacterized protein n=1 Tax=Paenibacillus baekrokdamisoli TaxID=1712516 RepID=A0A3G9JFR9_9BACL|nr:hypothetical protein [Paenibacillus baekrokdamisoli]MBB3068047.1 phage baseplate assembly protein gpV [Paenibacillus baekrokdamisoli]BBH22908.1 hypothetical protein Back11_42530 [Paenibacillus baekrokdamisoli]